jgi:DeoR family transcriptional regulator, suf operon transcriptional repressor
MTTGTSFRQEQILKLLLFTKNGLSIDEISYKLEISRNAIKQHLVVLEKEDLIITDNLKLNITGGRPSRNYLLTTKGINQFPKQYVWFSQFLLTELKSEMGDEAFKNYMIKLGNKLAQSLNPPNPNNGDSGNLNNLIEAMQMLGYHAEQNQAEAQPIIQAFNCVYHDLAQQFPELCEFDRALMSTWLNKPIEQTHCMAHGDCECKFLIK